MIISRRRFEAEIRKAQDETAEKFYAENNQRAMEAKMERSIDALNTCLDDRFRSMGAGFADLQRESEATRRDIDRLEDDVNNRFIADARAMGELKMEIAAIRELMKK